MLSRWRHALGMAFLLVSACVPALNEVGDAQVLCSADTDCPGGERCAATIGVCVVPESAEPPELASASATFTTTVEVTFSREMFIPSLRSAVYEITPHLPVLDAQPASDGRSVLLVTDPQAGGRIYTVAVNEVFDTLGAPVPAGQTVTFTGFGPAGDPEPPLLLAPESPGYLVDTGTVRLQWTSRFGAYHYDVEIAFDPEFSEAAPGSPWRSMEPNVELEVTLPVGQTYFWRVRANVTEVDAWATGSFALLDDTIYAGCEAGKSCTSAPELALGGARQPMRSIQRAIDVAMSLGIPRVRVAGRGNGAAYAEQLVVLGGGVTVEGGYNADFTEQDAVAHPTIIESEGIAFVIGAIRAPTTISGLTMRSLREAGLSVGNATDDLLVERCTIESAAEGMLATALRVGDSPSPGPRIRDNDISVTSRPGASFGALVASGHVQLEGNRVQLARTLGVENQGVGIFITGGAQASLVNNAIELAGSTNAFGVRAQNATVLMTGNLIELGPRSAFTTGVALVYGVVAELRGNFIHVHGASQTNVGITAGGWSGNPTPGSLWLENNVIAATGGKYVVGVDVLVPADVDPVPASLIHNTLLIDARNGDHTFNLALLLGGDEVVVNNLMACQGEAQTRAAGHFGEVLPATFHNNAMVGCDVLYNADTTGLTDIDAVNDLDAAGANTCETSRFANNIASNQTFAALFVDADGPDDDFATGADNDLRLHSGAGALRTAGRDTSPSDCGPCDALVSCGNVGTDITGAPRTLPVTVGAYEVQP